MQNTDLSGYISVPGIQPGCQYGSCYADLWDTLFNPCEVWTPGCESGGQALDGRGGCLCAIAIDECLHDQYRNHATRRSTLYTWEYAAHSKAGSAVHPCGLFFIRVRPGARISSIRLLPRSLGSSRCHRWATALRSLQIRVRSLAAGKTLRPSRPACPSRSSIAKPTRRSGHAGCGVHSVLRGEFTLSYSHISFYLTSGTGGLEEAI